MTQIIVKHYERREDGEYYCTHANIEITEPCCGITGGASCFCQGLCAVYCKDCDNEDLSEQQALGYIENAKL